MYTKEKKNRSLLNLILGIIAIIIIIFIIIWIINKGRTNANFDKVFDNNLQTMQENAVDYFSKNLPEVTGEVYKINLDEMIDLGLSNELYYGKTKCDEDASYISATKTSENTYQIKSNLVCANKEDNTVKRITVKYENSDDNNNVINNETNNTVVNENTNTNININTNTNTNTNTNKANTNTNKNTSNSDSCSKCTKGYCEITKEETECTTTYEYQYMKKSYGCPSGYTITSDGKCAKTVNKETNATKVYSEEKTVITDAKKTNDETVKIYTAPIIHAGSSNTTCAEGTLENGRCVTVKNATVKTDTTYSCPSDYDLSGNKCYKSTTDYINATATTTTSYTCPSGYTQSADKTKCTKATTVTTSPKATTTTSYTCPSGYTQSADKTKCTKTNTVTTSPNATTTTSYSCPSGYTQSADKTKCTKTTTVTASPVKNYTPWGNPVYSFDSTDPNLAYTSELVQVLRIGSGKVNGILYYSYEKYNRKMYYTCPNTYSPAGEVTGITTCTKSSTETINATKNSNTVYNCPTGYSPSGNVTSTTKCSKPSTETVNATAKTTTSYSCPSGYSQSGTKCYKSTTASINAISKTNTSYYCSDSNYSLNGNKCYKYTNPTTTTYEATYSCPNGYQKEVENGTTKCYKYSTTSGEYYCENSNATLSGNKCISKDESKFLYYSCPTGYSLNDNKCTISTTDITNMITTGTSYIYSSAPYLEGYIKTGRARYVQDCQPVK